jgi:hypothetical protein
MKINSDGLPKQVDEILNKIKIRIKRARMRNSRKSRSSGVVTSSGVPSISYSELMEKYVKVLLSHCNESATVVIPNERNFVLFREYVPFYEQDNNIITLTYSLIMMVIVSKTGQRAEFCRKLTFGAIFKGLNVCRMLVDMPGVPQDLRAIWFPRNKIGDLCNHVILNGELVN